MAVARVILKLIAMVVGLGGSVLGLMALAGTFVDNGWVRLGIAVVLALVPPLVLADRLIPRDDPIGAMGVPTDVLAVSWLVLTTLFVALAAGPMRAIVVADAERHWNEGRPLLARLELRVAGARVVEQGALPRPAPGAAPPRGRETDAGAPDGGGSR